MARQPTPQISDPASIRAAAAPVDTYIRPAQPARSSLHDVAKGLAALDSGLGSFLRKREQKNEQGDLLKGRAAFLEGAPLEQAEGVRRGLLKPDQSPNFVRGHKLEQGKALGQQMRTRFRDAFNQWEGRNSGDPEQFKNFLGHFVKDNLTSDDPDVLRGVLPYVDSILEGGYEQFSKESSTRLYNDAVNTGVANITEDIRESFEQGNAQGGVDYETIWKNLNEARSRSLGSGIRREDFDGKLVNSIIQEAVKEGDADILKLLERNLPGYDNTLSTLPAYQGLVEKARRNIEDSAVRRMATEAKEQEQRDKVAAEGAQRTILGAISENPNAELDESVIRAWEKHDPMARKKLLEARKTFSGGVEDDSAILKVYEEIRQGGGTDAVLRAKAEGVIRNPSTFNSMLDRVEKIKKYSEAVQNGVSDVRTDPTVKRYTKAINQRTGTGDLDIFGTKGTTDEGLEAQQDMERMAMEWVLANPEATTLEREKALNDIGKTILERVSEDGEYNSPEQSQREAQEQQERAAANNPPGNNTFDQLLGEEQEVKGSLVEPQEGDIKKAESLFRGDAVPSFEQLPESTKSQIELLSKTDGKTKEQLIMDLWKSFHDDLGTGKQNPDEVKGSQGSDYLDDLQNRSEASTSRDSTVGFSGVVQAGKGYTVVKTQGGGTVRREGTRAWRNHNPGNIEYGNFAKKMGAVGTDGRFAVFPSYEVGRRAKEALLFESPSYRDRSIISAINRYAPPFENDTNMYASEVAEAVGGNLNTKISSLSKSQRDRMLDAMERVEGFREGTEKVLEKGQQTAQVRPSVSPRLGTYRGELEGGRIPIVTGARGYKPDIENVESEVIEKFRQLQDNLGVQLNIASGYRDADRNRRSGGAKDSQHTHKKALDISVVSLSKSQRLEVIKEASRLGFTGIGVYNNSIHLDTGGRRSWGPSHKRASVPAWAEAAIQEHLSGNSSPAPTQVASSSPPAQVPQAPVQDAAPLEFPGGSVSAGIMSSSDFNIENAVQPSSSPQQGDSSYEGILVSRQSVAETVEEAVRQAQSLPEESNKPHFIVGPEGEVVQTAALNTGRLSQIQIGYAGRPSHRQKNAAKALARNLMQAFSIGQENVRATA